MTKTNLITGGCGFIGRNLILRLLHTTDDRIIIVDNLISGEHPTLWLGMPMSSGFSDISFFGENQRVVFIQQDALTFLSGFEADHSYLDRLCTAKIGLIHDFYHFAAIVGGRTTIDYHPMAVAKNMALDSVAFSWACNYKPQRMLYPSSSAAYPINLQSKHFNVALREDHIDFKNFGMPDNTYGWAKLSGEFLALKAVEQFGLHVSCIRPFSGYGESQTIDYPISALALRAKNHENPFTVWGSGEQERDFIHIEDILDCIDILMQQRGDGKAVNIGTGRKTTFIEVINILSGFAGYTPHIMPLPEKPVGVFSRYADMSHTKKLLNWEPKIKLEVGLRRVFNSVREEAVA
jgi:nucleoside-diphosphate-sugar epimerase